MSSPPPPPFTSSASADDLPRAHVKRMMRAKLARYTTIDSKTGKPFEPSIAANAVDGVGQACKIFIHFLTSTANDICKESKRSTLSAVRGESHSRAFDVVFPLSLICFLRAKVRTFFGGAFRARNFKNEPQSAQERRTVSLSLDVFLSFYSHHHPTHARARSLTYSRERKRAQDDVLRAVREIEFEDMEKQLKDHLKQQKAESEKRRELAAATAEQVKRQKLEEKEEGEEDDDDEGEEEEDEGEDEGDEGGGKD